MIHLESLYCAFAANAHGSNARSPRLFLPESFPRAENFHETYLLSEFSGLFSTSTPTPGKRVAAAREMEQKYPRAVVYRAARARKHRIGNPRANMRSRTRNISFRRRGNSGKQILRPEFGIDRRGRVARRPSSPDVRSETASRVIQKLG